MVSGTTVQTLEGRRELVINFKSEPARVLMKGNGAEDIVR